MTGEALMVGSDIATTVEVKAIDGKMKRKRAQDEAAICEPEAVVILRTLFGTGQNG